MLPHFKRAKVDENRVVEDYCKKGYPALRVPGSGNSPYFAGDVLAFTSSTVNLVLVRRSDTDKALFKKDEILKVLSTAHRIASLVYPNSVIVLLKAHFTKFRKWKEKILLDWNNSDVIIKCDEDV